MVWQVAVPTTLPPTTVPEQFPTLITGGVLPPVTVTVKLWDACPPVLLVATQL
jgi:hypothetical protein